MESTRLIFADSRNRDLTLYPSGSSYTLHLTTPIKNVTRVDLISVRVPNTMYNLTNGSNVLEYVGVSNVSLPPGFYNAGSLATALNSAAFPVAYLANEGHFVFSNTSSSFTININTAELSNLLGLPEGPSSSIIADSTLYPTYSNVIMSSTLIKMNANEYIFLDIDELKTSRHIDARALMGSTGTVSGSNINRAFAPLMMDVSSGCMKIYHENSDYTVSVSYPEPINSIQRLTIRWFDTNGKSIDFKGSDNHAFILRAHVLEEDSRRLPPPPPLQDVEIKRIIDAMTMVPPPPAPEKKHFPWVIIFLVLILGFIAWKKFTG